MRVENSEINSSAVPSFELSFVRKWIGLFVVLFNMLCNFFFCCSLRGCSSFLLNSNRFFFFFSSSLPSILCIFKVFSSFLFFPLYNVSFSLWYTLKSIRNVQWIFMFLSVFVSFFTLFIICNSIFCCFAHLSTSQWHDALFFSFFYSHPSYY